MALAFCEIFEKSIRTSQIYRDLVRGQTTCWTRVDSVLIGPCSFIESLLLFGCESIQIRQHCWYDSDLIFSFLYKMAAWLLVLFSLYLPNVYLCSPRFTSTASTFSRHHACSSTLSSPSSSRGFPFQNQGCFARSPSRPSITHSNHPLCALLWSYDKCTYWR